MNVVGWRIHSYCASRPFSRNRANGLTCMCRSASCERHSIFSFSGIMIFYGGIASTKRDVRIVTKLLPSLAFLPSEDMHRKLTLSGWLDSCHI